MPTSRGTLTIARLALLLVVVVVGIVPLVLDRDSFPLSTYPMFSSRRTPTGSVDTAVMVVDGVVERLTPSQIAGTDEVIIAAEVVSNSIRAGDADDLCREIAARSTSRGRIEIVTERYDALRWYEGDREPISRTVHATCEASR